MSNMSELAKWMITIITSLLIALGANYFVSSIQQENMNTRLTVMEEDVEEIVVIRNKVASMEVTSAHTIEALDGVVRALNSQTAATQELTNVVIRIDERTKD